MLTPRYQGAIPLKRAFARLAHGDVHYRAGGTGPVVLCLHESPRSSLSMLPVIDVLAEHYTVIAPDTPGYGYSDPLAEAAPQIEDFVAALAGFLDRLGLRRVALYGAHTGAALATAFAARHPGRVTSLALDGISAFTPDEVEAFHRSYLVPYQPRWDGTHVMALWSRVKDLYTWFPWYERTAECRLWHEPPSLATLHRSVLGFLQAGPHYSKAYAVAAAFQPGAVLRRLTMPVHIFARPDDLIAGHLARLGDIGTAVIRPLDDQPSTWRAALLDAVAAGPQPDVFSEAQDDEARSRLLRVGDGWMHAMIAGPRTGTPRMLLPRLPGDLEALLETEREAHPEALLVALSPPGCGRSDPLAGDGFALRDVILALQSAWESLSLGPPASCLTQGASCALGRLWAAQYGWACPVETAHEPVWLSKSGRTGSHPGLSRDRPLLAMGAPDWDGVYLTGAWFQLRDLELYDIPPGCGVPARRAPDAPEATGLDRIFRSLIEGPECAKLLAMINSQAELDNGASCKR